MQQRTIRMPWGRVRSSAAVAVAGCLAVIGVLAGCDSQAETPGASSPPGSATSSAPSPSASSSPPSPSASASPSVAIPPAARVKSDKGAEAFVRYFFDQVNVAWTKPDPSAIEANSEKGCESCKSLATTASELKAKGRKYASPPVTVKNSRWCQEPPPVKSTSKPICNSTVSMWLTPPVVSY